MPLIVKEFSPKGGECRVLNHLKSLYENLEHDVFLFHDLLMCVETNVHFRPDYILLDPKRGMAIIEVKSFKPHEIELWDQFDIHFKNGSSDKNPFKKGQEYQFKLEGYLREKGIHSESLSIESHLVFINLEMEEEQSFVTAHYKDFKNTLTLENLFRQKVIPDFETKTITLALNPIMKFKMPFGGDLKSEKTKIKELDNLQEKIIEKDLKGHYLVKGIPGSGKSIAVISRAIYTLKNEPNWRVLVLCVNGKLRDKNQKEISERTKGFEALGYNPKNIEVQTLMGFLISLCHKFLPDKNYSTFNYLEGIDERIKDLSEIPVQPIWDSILIDEYQDFTDEQLELIKSLAIPKEVIINKKEVTTQNLFLAGDSLQQIHEAGCSNSWSRLGINIIGRGRSESLKSSYRCGQEILDISLNFLKSASKTMEKEVDHYYEGTEDLKHLRPGENHFHMNSKWWMNSFGDVNQWMQSLINEGAHYSDFIIICPNRTKNLKEISKAFKKEIDCGLTVGMPSTIKGLEAPYCIILNMDYVGNRDKKIDNKYKKIYMCLTRASRGIFINTCKEDNNEYVTLLNLIEGRSLKKAG